jgi:type IV pilus secretin PilQ/predicted competence protein
LGNQRRTRQEKIAHIFVDCRTFRDSASGIKNAVHNEIEACDERPPGPTGIFQVFIVACPIIKYGKVYFVALFTKPGPDKGSRMKSWRVIAGMSLWLLASGCARDGVLRIFRSGDSPSPPAAVAKSDQTAKEPEFPRTPINPVQFGKPTLVDTDNTSPLPEPPGKNEVRPASPRQVGTVAFRSQQELPQPRKLENAKPITLVLDDVEIAKALDLLGKEGNLNILISSQVTGRVTANLKGMTLDQALESLMKVSNLVAVREKGLIYVYTADEKLPMRIYHLNYTRAQDLEKMIKPLMSPKGKLIVTPPSAVGINSPSPIGGSGGGTPPAGGGGASGGTSLTGGDSLSSDGAIIVQDHQSVLEAVDRVVAELDVQPTQVLIEAVILVVNLNKGQELGINFAVLNSGGNMLSVVGNGALLNNVVGFLPALAQSTGLGSTGFAANQFTPGPLAPPASIASGGFANNQNMLNIGGANRNVAAFMQALETLGKTEVLATPRLLVLNRQLAEIKLSQQLGYSTFSQSQVSTVQQVQFLDVGTQLRVRPFVSSDGMVRMEIHPERSSGSVVNNVPNTTTASVTSNVMVPNGATIVIGGLMEKIPEVNQTGVPFLGRIPYFGALFRDRQTSDTRNEVIVLLTPRIWNPNNPEGLNTAGCPSVPVTPLQPAPEPRLFP